MYYERKDFDAALKDFNRSIDIYKSDALAYNNRCILYYDTGKYCECLNDYREAIRINKDDVEEYKYVSLLNNFYTEIGEEIKTEVKDKILAVFGKMMAEIIYNIRQIALDHDGKQIAHYTKLNVADLMIYDQADQPAKGKKLRYYNAVYMNDPQEGMILLEYLKSIAGAQYETIEAAFNTGKVDDNNVYLGSFLPEDHKDDLVMWRTYGKDEKGVEGGGCSIVIDTDFFDASDVNESLQQLSFSANRQASATKVTRQPLYRVLYYNRRKNEFITDINEKSKKDNDDLKKHLKLLVDEIISLLTFKEAEQSPINSTIDKIVYYALSELRYFFKSADYSFENEYRVIVNAKSTDDTVKVDEGSTPRRLYIESNKHIQNVASGEEKKNYIKEVTLGPKVPNPERWIYLDASMKKKGFNDFQLKRSECRYQ